MIFHFCRYPARCIERVHQCRHRQFEHVLFLRGRPRDAVVNAALKRFPEFLRGASRFSAALNPGGSPVASGLPRPFIKSPAKLAFLPSELLNRLLRCELKRGAGPFAPEPEAVIGGAGACWIYTGSVYCDEVVGRDCLVVATAQSTHQTGVKV